MKKEDFIVSLLDAAAYCILIGFGVCFLIKVACMWCN